MVPLSTDLVLDGRDYGGLVFAPTRELVELPKPGGVPKTPCPPSASVSGVHQANQAKGLPWKPGGVPKTPCPPNASVPEVHQVNQARGLPWKHGGAPRTPCPLRGSQDENHCCHNLNVPNAIPGQVS